MAKQLDFGFVCPKNIVSKALQFVQMQPYKPRLCCHVLLEKSSIAFALSEHLGESPRTSTPGKIGTCLESFPLENIFSHCGMMAFKSFGNGTITLHRLIGSKNYFFKITADVFPPRNCVKVHLKVPDQQTAKTSFMISYSSAPGCSGIFILLTVTEVRGKK